MVMCAVLIFLCCGTFAKLLKYIQEKLISVQHTLFVLKVFIKISACGMIQNYVPYTALTYIRLYYIM